jgi:tRNA(fMet)-specific endonuclease VapC
LLLDTNIFIYVINQKSAHVIERFKQHQLGDIAISSITAAVLAFGIKKSSAVRNRLAF